MQTQTGKQADQSNRVWRRQAKHDTNQERVTTYPQNQDASRWRTSPARLGASAYQSGTACALGTARLRASRYSRSSSSSRSSLCRRRRSASRISRSRAPMSYRSRSRARDAVLSAGECATVGLILGRFAARVAAVDAWMAAKSGMMAARDDGRDEPVGWAEPARCSRCSKTWRRSSKSSGR